ncbi:MAG TPA: hypothetical protein VJT50_06520, partial [Pyrinomonadaceae bacterium]|nr:hypothetical protein [Pyrinomonadaceae bacterium]
KTLATVSIILSLVLSSVAAQEEARAVWQVTKFDITADVQHAERQLSATAVLSAANVGRGSGASFTFRINSKAVIKTVTVSGANATFRSVPESSTSLQRITVTLPSAIAPDGTVAVTISYTLPLEGNTGLAAISPIGSQFLPLSFWYPSPSTPFSSRGADRAAIKLAVNGAGIISSGTEKAAGSGAIVYENQLPAQPFFVQGDWERVEGTAENKNIIAFLPRGAGADDRRRAEALVSLAGSARAFYSALFGPAPDVPIRLVSARRGAGFDDSGTVLLETGAFRRAQTDSTTALLISEGIARLWIGGQTPVRGDAGGVLREGLTRFLATQFIEKQFGRNAADAERLRERVAYSAVVLKDAPLSKITPLDPIYFNAVPNKGAMVWRLIERRLGPDAFTAVIRDQLTAGKGSGLSLAMFRAALAERGGDAIKNLVDQQLDQVTDLDLMIGLPQQRGAEWVSALRNLGQAEAVTTAAATTASGERIAVDVTVPPKGFGEAIFKSAQRLVRVEIDPDKLYPQLDYANDIMPKAPPLQESLNDATRQLGAQDFVKAETTARALLLAAPQFQEANIVLGRALLGQNRDDDAQKIFNALLEQPLPTPAAIAWANIGLGEIALKKGQFADAAKRFTDAVRADAEYGSSLAARNDRIKAESAANILQVDPAIRTFIGQLDQAIASGKKVEIEPRVVPGELQRFISGVVGTQPEYWRTKVLRTEQLDADLFAADVALETKELGKEQAGSALYILSRNNGNWRLVGIDLFEVR